jgi:hypothetical protein
MTRHRHILLLVGCLLLSSTGCPRKPAKDDSHTPLAIAEPLSLTSEELCQAFAADPEAANEKYKERWMRVEGPLYEIMLRPGNGVAVILHGARRTSGGLGRLVRCLPNATSRKKIYALTRGQSVKFKGRCLGEGDGTFTDLADAELLSTGPDPALTVSAGDLTRAFARDSEAAHEKYKGRQVLALGVVATPADRPTDRMVLLEGFDEKAEKPIRVTVRYGVDWQPEFAKLLRGDKVKIKGECLGLSGRNVALESAWLVP